MYTHTHSCSESELAQCSGGQLVFLCEVHMYSLPNHLTLHGHTSSLSDRHSSQLFGQ